MLWLVRRRARDPRGQSLFCWKGFGFFTTTFFLWFLSLKSCIGFSWFAFSLSRDWESPEQIRINPPSGGLSDMVCGVPVLMGRGES